MRVISIDPGISGTGLAIWELDDWKKNVTPVDAFNIMPKADLDWVLNSAIMTKKLNEIVTSQNIVRAYIEFPQYFASAVGHAASADGKIFKLASLVGSYMAVLWLNSCQSTPIEVNTWKGQLSKPAVIARMYRKLPALKEVPFQIDSHSFDAVGIGMYAKGFF